MTKSHKRAREDVDLPTLGRALWHAKGWIVGLALGAGLVTFVALSMDRPVAAASHNPRPPQQAPRAESVAGARGKLSIVRREPSGDEDNDVGP